MGADIYLESLNDEHRKQHEPLFKTMCARRDAFIDKHGRAVIDRDPKLSKQVAKLQEYVSEAYEILMDSPGYFRDSYNDTSLFWLIGLSWWELGDHYLDEDRNLPIANAKRLLEMMQAAEPGFDEMFDEWVEKKRAGKKKGVDGALYDEKPWTFKGKENGVEDWRKMFRTKLDRWIELLKRSIEMNEPLHWSV
jgi:hypothetical protein